MDLIKLQFPAVWQGGAFALMSPVLFWAAFTAPWRRFDASEPAHVWYGTIFGLTLLWSIKASIAFGFTFHLLGVSLFTLLAGPQLALIGTALVVAIVTALRDGWWANYALNTLAIGALPVVLTTGALRATERWLPPNLFIYIFVVAFFGPGLAMFVTGLSASAAVVFGGAQSATVIFDQYLPYLIHLGFGEATVTGMLITLLVVYRPAWVTTFDDARYLRGR
jgi:uncharacterized membrane protein